MKILYSLFVVILVILVCSCNKKNDDTITYVRGRVIEHCATMKPKAHYNVSLSQSNSWGRYVQSWQDTTDSEGYFDIACVGLLETPIELNHIIGNDNSNSIFSAPLDEGFFPKTGDTYNLGTIFLGVTHETNLQIQIENDHPISDTLYVGRAANPTIIYPIVKGTYNVKVGFGVGAGSADNGIPAYRWGFGWGIGKDDFSGTNNSLKHLIWTTTSPCISSTSTLIVP